MASLQGGWIEKGRVRRSKKNLRHLDIFYRSRCTLFLAVSPRLVQLQETLCVARYSLRGDSSMGLVE